ncbi:acetate--CoA ligase family protein [Ferviditalea candida]|uniref:Acetate--CoA ligase family protein n=1 Tax=Ferviditalea candida TaxID=3108399 RepID=A0ABU5ZFW0_9BACL|nr:acetate--CoA ligase family protein [Paenibacillaceae bacterium T2]
MNHNSQVEKSLAALLKPESIAIAGASADRGKIGSLPLQFLKKHSFSGRVYPINPNAEEIEGWKCYSSVSDVPDPIDLLVIAVSASRIPDILNDCREGQVKSALILSSGFAETGKAGAERQQQLLALAGAKGIRFVGPNSVGVVNLWSAVVPAISQVFDQTGLKPGPVAFVTQSGALGTAITAIAHEEGIGIGYFVSTGNEADLDFSDFCQFFIDDPAVTIISGYVEGIRDGAKFKQTARRAIAAGKPIVLMKVGKTDVGHDAVRSHTGALAGSDEIYEAVFKENGVVRAESIEELMDVLKIFSCYPAHSAGPGRSGRKAAVFSHSGGAGVLMADQCVKEGLELPSPSTDLREKLGQRLPSYASLQNPVDMTANVVFLPDVMCGSAYDAVRSGEYDAVMLCVNLIWRQGDALAEQLLAERRQTDGMLGVVWIAGPKEPIRKLNRQGVPVFSDPVRCVKAVAAKLKWEQSRARILETVPAELHVEAGTASKAVPDGFAAQEALLRKYGIPLAPAQLARNWEEAKEAAGRLAYPIALKLIAPGLLHKSDIGGVAVGIASEAELRQAYERLTAIQLNGIQAEGILVQQMIEDGTELFAGVKRDPVFGPVTVLGLGGIYVEILKESLIRPSPISEKQAMEMIRSARFYPLLDGARGRQKCDVPALARLLSRLSVLSVAEPVQSIDLNPIMMLPDSAIVVDYKFMFDSGRGE